MHLCQVPSLTAKQERSHSSQDGYLICPRSPGGCRASHRTESLNRLTGSSQPSAGVAASNTPMQGSRASAARRRSPWILALWGVDGSAEAAGSHLHFQHREGRGLGSGRQGECCQPGQAAGGWPPGEQWSLSGPAVSVGLQHRDTEDRWPLEIH